VLNLKNKKLIFYLCAGLIVILAAGSISFFKNPLFSISKIPYIVFNAVRREVTGAIFYHRNYVQNERLEKENDYLRQKSGSLDEIILENSRLKRMLGFKQQAPFKVIAARVIARSPDNWSSLILIDKGSSSGIRKGQSVVHYQGLIGRVMDTNSDTARVILISDPNLSVSAAVERSREAGLVIGTLGTQLLLKYLSPEADIRVGDKIITSGMNQNYPKGIFIGTVVDIGSEFSNLGRYAVIKPAVNLSFVEEVFVIVK